MIKKVLLNAKAKIEQSEKVSEGKILSSPDCSLFFHPKHWVKDLDPRGRCGG